ncbi:MAG TPA: long-chain fatty acid--CoA ligase [Myxococcota bacterium]|nr:long-chain fatty acid--CoA ligase [Myxococcota bacterium]
MDQAVLRKKKAERAIESVPELLLYRIGETPEDVGWEYPDASGRWVEMTWRECGQRVRALAAGLRAIGIESEQRVSILATTRIEWILADLAVMCAGAAVTTIYPSNTPAECKFIINDSDTRIVFAENQGQADKLVSIRAEIPQVTRVITFEGPTSADGWVMSWADFEAMGKAEDARDPDGFERVIAGVKRDHLATLIYTSGTTGVPKGVILVHDNWVFESEVLDQVNLFEPTDKQYLWLPMSHSFGKVLEVITIGGNIRTAVDGRDPKKVVDNLAIIKPTWMGAPPRIFEKAFGKIVQGAQTTGGLKWKIFQWALSVGREVSRLRQEYREPTGLLKLQYAIANKLVFSKIKDRFGGRIRFLISGSAPLSREMAEFFHAVDMPILEGYGLTESSAASFVNLPHNFKFGTVGPPLPGIQVRIDAETGEVQFNGRGIMRGYHNRPDETEKSLRDGWLLTGDQGEIDAGGRLRITGRIKELIKTSGGKYVAPAQAEAGIKAASTLVGQVVVHGDNRNYCVALVTLDPDRIVEWAEAHGQSDKSFAELSALPEMRTAVQAAVDEVNKTLASYATIKKFLIITEDFTVENGLLTASFKVKRKEVEKRYKAELDKLYA